MNDSLLPFRLIQRLRAEESTPAATAKRPLRRASRLLSLEQRFMFDGAAMATVADASHAKPDVHAAAQAAEAAAASAAQVREADTSRNGGKKEVAFVDTSVADYQSLEAGIRDGVAIVEFDGSKDGLAQIAQWAQTQSGYDAIHILSHGSEGKLNLGSTVLGDASLSSAAVQTELADIGHALNAGGDLLLYGCDVAAGPDGQRFIDDLARITGADVAASTNASGATDIGGDWTLEAHAGAIETDALHIDAYRGLLTLLTFDPLVDTDLTNFDQTSITRIIDGKTFTLSGGEGSDPPGLGAISAADTGDGSSGIYAYEGPGAEIKLTISIEAGYMFELSAFDTSVISGSLTIDLTYANGQTASLTVNSLNNAWQTLSSFSAPTSRVTQVVLSSSDFGLFQNFDITNVRAIPSAPTVSDANIAITSTPTGTDGTYKIGDTVTAIWTNAAGSEVDSVTMDFSQFGGGSAVVATNSGDIWTASYTITSGAIDAANRNVSVKAVNAGGATPVADTTNLSVDNAAPTVTDGRTSISGGSGPGGAYKIGDTVTATWNNTAGGDNNTDTISGVTFDFSQFGGPSAVAAINSGGIWTATYTIAAGAIDTTNRNVSVKVTDNAGNTTTTFDTTNATIDNIAPTVTDANIGIGGGTGPGGAYKIGDTVSASWYNTIGGDNNADTVSGVTFDFSQFGGGSAVAATNSGGIWTATYTITAGAIDATNRHVSVTVKDNAGNATTTVDTTNATVDNIAPTITDANISISGGSGPGGAYKIGDTVSTSWYNTIGGDNNADTISGVTFDFSQFGGGSAVAAINSGGIWTATYTIAAGAIDTTNRNVSVKVTDNAGNATTMADTTNATVDNIAPTATDGNISISGGSGPGGAYKIGDTVTATWNNTAGGDNNTDTISGVTFDFSQFGGPSAVAATNSGGTWTATYTIAAGAIDTSNRNVSVKVTDNAGNSTTTADTTNATVDNIAPTITDANIGISGGSGPGGTYKIGDTVTATWNNSAGGDNNTDTISGVTFDFSQFGGGSAVTATNSGGVWTAAYTLVAGSIDGLGNRNVSVTATDNAGNTKTTADTTNATVDTVKPATTLSGIALSADTGTSNSDFLTNIASQTITATLSAGLGAGDVVYGSLNNGASWTDITDKVSGTTLTWDGVTLTGSGTIKLQVTDAAGNDGATAAQAYTLDTNAPATPSAPKMTSGSNSGASTDNITNDTTPTFTGTAESGSTVTLYDTDGTTVLGTATATGGAWSITSSTLGTGEHTLTAKATDAAGNTSTASSGLTVVIDTAAPAGFNLSATTVASLNATSGSNIATLLSSDDTAVTYSFATGNGVIDADNGSFSIVGDSLRVGAAALGAGTYHIYVAATDAAGNAAYKIFTLSVVDAPSVSSIGGASATVNTAASTISYTVTFSEAVTGVDAGDFSLTSTGTAMGAIAGITGSGTTYTVTVNTLAGDGTLRLDLKNAGTGIQNGGSIDIAGGYTAGATYTLDHTAPAAPSAPDMTSGTDTGVSNTDNIAKNTTPTFTGTAESGSTVTLYDTDGVTVLGTATASGGSWSITSSALAEGTHTLTAKATDAAGNISNASSGLAVSIDTTAPTLTITSNVASLKAGETATITFTFSEDPGSTFSWDGSAGDIVVSGGTLSALSGSGLTRTATFTPTAGTDNGSASITVAAGSYTDAAGNNGGAGLTPSLTFDTLHPDAPSTPDMTNASDTGASNTDNITRNNTPTFTGTAEAGALVTLYDSDGTTVLGSATATGGNWSITSSALGDGPHTITAKATDAAGNVSDASAGLNITIDTSAPAAVASAGLSSDSGTSGSDFITRTAAQTISGTLGANLGSGETVQVSLDDGQTWVDANATVNNNTWSYAATLTGSGTLQVRVVDTAGNIGGLYSHDYALDTSAPTVASVSVPGNGTYYADQTLDFTVHFSEAVTVDTGGGTPRLALTIGGATVYATYRSGSGSGDLVFSYTVADGNQDSDGVTVGALSANGGSLRDSAGNDATLTLNSVGSTAAVNVDGALPRIVGVSADSPDSHYKAGDTVSITVTFDHAVTVDTDGGTPTLSLSGGGSARYTSGSGGTTLVFSYTVGAGQNSADLDYTGSGALALNGGAIKAVTGAHPDAILTLQAPGAGGSLGAARDIVIDTTPPAAPTVDSVNTSGPTPVLGGSATLGAGETLTVSVGGATYRVVPSDGHWQLDLATATPDSGALALVPGNSYSMTATVTDAAGNASVATGVLAVIAPPPPSIAPASAVEPSAGAGIGAEAPPAAGAVAMPFLSPSLEATLRGSSLAAATAFFTISFAPDAAPAERLVSGDQAFQPTLTQGGNFPVVVVPAATGGEGLILNRGIGDQAIPSSGHLEIGVPSDAFAHTDPNASIQLSARQADGRPLPNWIRFDSASGKFTIQAPKGVSGDIAVKVIARDRAGHAVTSVFHLRLGAKTAAQAEPGGRSGLSEQFLHAARQRGGADAFDRLAGLARALQWPNT